MNDQNTAVLELSKLCSVERVIVDRLVSAKPIWLFSVHVEPDNAANKTQVKLINGEISTAEVKYNLKVQYAHLINTLPRPIYFNRGLFIDFVDNVSAVTVQYMIERT